MAEMNMLPAQMATASKGMTAGMAVPAQTLAQSFYHSYYPLAAGMDRLQNARVAAEANPAVDVANAMAQEYNKMEAEFQKRADSLVAIAKQEQAARAKLNAARLKSLKSGGGGARVRDVIDLIEAINTGAGKIATAEEARREAIGAEGLREQARTYGDIGSLGTSAKGAMQQFATTIARQGTGDTATQLRMIAENNAEGVNAIRAAQADGNELVRGSHARAMAQLLSDPARMGKGKALSDDEAAVVAAGLFNVPTDYATAKGAGIARQQFSDALSQIPAGGEGEERLGINMDVGNEVLRRLVAQGFGSGGPGAAYAAEVKRQEAEKLNPQEQVALDVFLSALRNDGKVEVGEMVSPGAGQEARPISKEEIEDGRKVYLKAQRLKAYRPEDAAWFDEESLEKFRNQVEYGAKAKAKRDEAVARGARTPEEVRQEMAREYTKQRIAAENLEVYIDPTTVSSALEQEVLGGALHIARNEGEGVFDMKASHEDRARRLGGTGPLAQSPLRFSQRVYRQLQDPDNDQRPVDPAQLQAGMQQIRRRFRRDPKKAKAAMQYLLAQNMVLEQKQSNLPANPRNVADDTPPPVAAPAAPEPAAPVPAPAPVPVPAPVPAPAPARRAAAQAPAPAAASVSPAELDAFLASRAGAGAGTTYPVENEYNPTMPAAMRSDVGGYYNDHMSSVVPPSTAGGPQPIQAGLNAGARQPRKVTYVEPVGDEMTIRGTSHYSFPPAPPRADQPQIDALRMRAVDLRSVGAFNDAAQLMLEADMLEGKDPFAGVGALGYPAQFQYTGR
jgi:hypothetical protein